MDDGVETAHSFQNRTVNAAVLHLAKWLFTVLNCAKGGNTFPLVQTKAPLFQQQEIFEGKRQHNWIRLITNAANNHCFHHWLPQQFGFTQSISCLVHTSHVGDVSQTPKWREGVRPTALCPQSKDQQKIAKFKKIPVQELTGWCNYIWSPKRLFGHNKKNKTNSHVTLFNCYPSQIVSTRGCDVSLVTSKDSK